MEDIAFDPIIAFYIKMSNSTDNETEVPLFSETMLRLSFKQVVGSMRQCPLCPKELLLYRKLLLFNFSLNYTSIEDLVAIMTCFDEKQIREYFDKHESIIAQWYTFLKERTSLFKDALYEILYEYTRRHRALFGVLQEEKLKKKFLEIKKFLHFKIKGLLWYRSFNSMLKNRMKKDIQPEDYKGLTIEDLNIHNVYLDVRKKLNILVVQEVSKYENECFKEPAAKKTKPDELNIIKQEVIPTSYPAHVIVESQDHKDKYYADAEAYDIDTEIQIKNELEFNDEEYEFTSSSYEHVETVTKEEEILQEVDKVKYDDSDYEYNMKTSSEQKDNDDNFQNTDSMDIYNISKFESGETNDADNTKTEGGIVSKDTALSYLLALQAYVVVNGHYQAIELLDKVDSLLREQK